VALWAAIALLWLALVAAAWLAHRLLVVPYLLYTTDVYREEFTRRHRRALRDGRPFTKKEIRRDERLQEG
jgi:hypothetical protein